MAMDFYRNEKTGAVLPVPAGETCPDAEAVLLTPNTTDAAQEKHVPVYTRDGQTVTVSVGSVAHPMTEAHFITFILLETASGVEKQELTPDAEPVAQFFAAEDDEILGVYAYCNLHGLWKA